MVVPRGSINLRVDAPIILGSVPLQGLTPFSLPPPVTATAAVPSFPAATAAPAMPEPPATAAPAFQRKYPMDLENFTLIFLVEVSNYMFC